MTYWAGIKELEWFDSPGRSREIRKITDLEVLEKHQEVALQRVRRLEEELNRRFVAKEEIIRMVIVSAIAEQPLLLVGEPGTAKSKVIIRFCEGMGMRRVGSDAPPAGGVTPAAAQEERSSYFQYLLHGFTEPDEILGVLDIQSLRGIPEKGLAPVFKRLELGSITAAEVVFLDEVFRSNSAILNSLLSIINERRVYEGGQARPAKCRLIYGATNSIPGARQLEELRAFYERFVIRMESLPVPPGTDDSTDPNYVTRRELLARGWKDEVQNFRAGYDPQDTAMDQIASLNDLLWLNRLMAESWGGANLADPEIKNSVDRYQAAVSALKRTDLCRIDDRKFIRLFGVLRAHALYTHGGPPKADDLEVLAHIWDNPEAAAELQEYVQNLIKRLR